MLGSSGQEESPVLSPLGSSSHQPKGCSLQAMWDHICAQVWILLASRAKGASRLQLLFAECWNKYWGPFSFLADESCPPPSSPNASENFPNSNRFSFGWHYFWRWGDVHLFIKTEIVQEAQMWSVTTVSETLIHFSTFFGGGCSSIPDADSSLKECPTDCQGIRKRFFKSHWTWNTTEVMDISSLVQLERLWGLRYEPGHTSQISGLQAAGDLPVPKIEVLKQQWSPQRLLTCSERGSLELGSRTAAGAATNAGWALDPSHPLCPLLLQPGRGCICSAEPDTELMLRVIKQ